MRIRKDVWKLSASDPWHPVLLWYGRAVAAMQKRPLTDPASWRYQAAIHMYTRGIPDTLVVKDEVEPPQSEQSTFWNQCQHSSWFFFPWHRGYLLYFEQIVASTVQQLGGPSDWALPYWNYSDSSNPNAVCLPPAFYAITLPDGTPNPLRVFTEASGNLADIPRSPNANTGDPIAGPADVSLICLSAPRFSASGVGNKTGFGGTKTWFNHIEGPNGFCEAVPHATMHVAVGGNVGGKPGWMANFATAGLDPLFWLHHANIDRLWEVWLRRSSKHTNPADSAWRSSWRSALTLNFHDALGNRAALKVDQVLDTAATLLDYQYEDVTDPLPAEERDRRAVAEAESISEMVGATSQALVLGKVTSSVTFELQAPSGPAAMTDSQREVLLSVENITAAVGPTDSYLVYINLGGSDYRSSPEREAGILPLFGVGEASRPNGQHPGNGLNYVLDITPIVSRLEAKSLWNSNSLQVSFVPHVRPGADPNAEVMPVTVGRVSLHYA